jgi:hypothetical protein
MYFPRPEKLQENDTTEKIRLKKTVRPAKAVLVQKWLFG